LSCEPNVALIATGLAHALPPLALIRRSGFSRLAHGEKVLEKKPVAAPRLKPSAFLDTRVVYCGDNLEPIIKRSRKSSAS
jgi:hypothetical protein